jgi:hypothetical protein
MVMSPIGGVTTERTMSPQNYETEITRCPTACAAPTHGSGSANDRAALRQRAERLEAIRQDKARQAWARAVAAA